MSALERGADLGECVTVLEKEFSKQPLPGDVRREDIKVLRYNAIFNRDPSRSPNPRPNPNRNIPTYNTTVDPFF